MITPYPIKHAAVEWYKWLFWLCVLIGHSDSAEVMSVYIVD